MSNLESERPARRLPTTFIIFLIVVIGLMGAAYYLAPRFDRQAPQVKLPDADVLGPAPMEVVVADPGAGLKSVSATLTVGGAEHTLASEQYAQPLHEKKITVALGSNLTA